MSRSLVVRCPTGYGRKVRGEQWKDGPRTSVDNTVGNERDQTGDQGEKRGEASWHKLVSGPQIFQWQYRLWPQIASESW